MKGIILNTKFKYHKKPKHERLVPFKLRIIIFEEYEEIFFKKNSEYRNLYFIPIFKTFGLLVTEQIMFN